jgi:hypothetical protein
MKPESSFIRRVHYRLAKLDPDRSIFYQHIPAGEGIPDYYYEADGAHLWVEYKVHPNRLSRKQARWIERARANKQPCWVASWHPKKEVVLVETGCHTIEAPLDEFVELLVRALVGNKKCRT